MEQLRKETVSGLRACLTSVKGKLDMHQLDRDYMKLMGTQVQWRKLGHSSFEDFLKSEPTISLTRAMDGALLVDAKTTDANHHLVEMIARQKTAVKKKPRFIPRAPRYSQPSYQYQQNDQPKWRPKNVSTKWKTTYENSPRQAAISHNQVVNVYRSPANEMHRPPPTISPQRTPAYPPHQRVTINNNQYKEELPPKHTVMRPEMKKSLARTISQEKNSNGLSKVPNSTRTNRASIMQNVTNVMPSPLKLSGPTTAIENLKNEALAAIDPKSPLWNNWSSGSESDTGTELQEFTASGDAVVDLFSFTKYRKLSEPIFKSHHHQPKPHKPMMYACQVKVDGQSFSSYPNDCFDEISAKYMVAKTALQKLIGKYGTSKRKSLLLSNELDVVERVPPIIQKHFNGVWSWQIEADYRDHYGEELPLNWLDIINTSPNISIEAFDGKFVLRYCRPEDLLQKGKLSILPLSCDISIPTSTVQIYNQDALPAEITCAVSIREIWCRLINTDASRAFDEMLSKLKAFYSQDSLKLNSLNTPVVAKGCFYAARLEDTWFRVRVLAVEEETVHCLLVDRGDDQRIPAGNFYQLRREFAKEKSQAFICRLVGLEELYEESVGADLLAPLEGMKVTIEPCIDDSLNGENLNSQFVTFLNKCTNSETSYDPLPAVLVNSDTLININHELLDKIILQNALPTLDESSANEVYITHVEPEGSIYIQMRTIGFCKLMTILQDLETTINESSPDINLEPVTPENSDQRLYYTQTKEDEHYHRVRIIDWAPDKSHVQIFYSDTGRTAVIRLQDSVLYPLDEISEIAYLFPEQALRVMLDVDAVPDNYASKIKAIVPDDSAVLLRIVDEAPDQTPIVKLFIRVPNVGLVSVNESINIETQIKKVPSRPEKLEKLNSLDYESPKNVPSSGNLSSPHIPKVGEYFDVKVPCAVNPWNFFVQPYASYDTLTKLMKQLQTRYEEFANTYSPLCIDDIEPGKIYASRHTDGVWYRTSVIKVILPNSISVFYCDFGYYANLKLSQLLPLDPHFLELPYQAIKAKLTGIKPKQEKWTMDDCKHFQKMVCRKLFCSILTAIDKDELYRSDTVLGLKLIDTMTSEDVHIEELLVQRQIAVRTSPQ